MREAPFKTPVLQNPYGSSISHGGEVSPTLEDHLYTPYRERSLPSQLSPQLTPSQPSLGRGEEPLLSQEVNLVSQPEVPSSTLQEMDVDIELTLPCPRTDDAEDVQNPPALDEIALVEPSLTKRDVINYSNISSYDLQRHVLGESTDGDSDEDNEGVDQGVAFHAVADPQQPLP